MSASAADIAAARALLGGPAETHERVRDLPGADMCPHALTGAGVPLADATGSLGEYRETPYRHHTFTAEARPDPLDRDVYCQCGNMAPSKIHPPCFEKGE